MATTKDYVDYVREQLSTIGDLTIKKVFGEYMIYLNGKPVIIVCNNTAYVKKHPAIESLMKNVSCGYPYESAKEHYILDIDQSDFNKQVIIELEKVTPQPKSKLKK